MWILSCTIKRLFSAKLFMQKSHECRFFRTEFFLLDWFTITIMSLFFIEVKCPHHEILKILWLKNLEKSWKVFQSEIFEFKILIFHWNKSKRKLESASQKFPITLDSTEYILFSYCRYNSTNQGIWISCQNCICK